jgi:hypothetical protein
MATRGRWKPGQSGNPHGRPPNEQTIANALREVGNRIDPATGKRNVLRLAEVAYELGIGGNVAAINFIAERVEGKAISVVDMKINRGGDVREYSDDELLMMIEKARKQQALVHEGPKATQ